MKCPQCASSDVDRLDGTLVCTQCGHVLGESEIVNDVTFGETSAGAATVQGTQVNASGRHAMIGPGGRKYGDGDGRAATMFKADTEIRGLCRRLGIESVPLHQTASRIFQLALNIGQGATPFFNPVTKDVASEGGSLVPGRKSEYSYGACVYLALRRAKVPIMLIEVADAVKVNVFVLGRAYLRLTTLLRFDPDQRDLSLADPSLYIRRFAKMLDFGDEEDKVILDATRLCARFKHDWLVQGRRPSGITGACLLIAARMNNFRRSVAEIVQVVKVADTTLKRRLDEFRDSKAGSMSIAEFRQMWDAPAEQDVLPPSTVRNRKKEAEAAKKKEDAKEAGSAEDDGYSDIENGSNDEPIDERIDALAAKASQADNTQLEDQVDGAIAGEVQQFLDSNLLRNDLDQALQAQDASERRARMTATERAQALSEGMTTTGSSSQPTLESQSTVAPPLSQAVANGSHAWGYTPDEGDVSTECPRKRRRKSKKPKLPKEDQGDPLAGLDEDELDGYLLDEEEQAIKERVWTEFNKEYLQQALVKALKEEDDLKRGLPPSRAMRRRQGRVIRDAANAMGTSAADAATKMLQARRFSQKINYAALGNMFPGVPEDEPKPQGRPKKGKHRAQEHGDGLDDPDGLGAAMDYVDGDAFDAAQSAGSGDESQGELPRDHVLRGPSRGRALKHKDKPRSRTRHASVGAELSEGASASDAEPLAHDPDGFAATEDDGYERRDEAEQWDEYDA